MDRKQARKLAEQLVDKMTLEEMAEQLRFDAPAIERLGINEYNWWSEGLHGVARAGSATVFPQAIGMAASWDDELIEKEAQVISTEARAKYNAYTAENDRDIYKGLTLWSPNINIFRDPRWGRGHETLGEDPYLTSRLGVAFVKGLQGDGEFRKIGACAKHFAVHSGPEAIRHSFDAKATKKDMWETYLPAFETLVIEGDVESVMGAYNRTNGEPCCANTYLMEDVLRGMWKFEGHYVSDCWAVRDFHENHKVTASPEESAALALRKGCDLNCGCTYRSILSAYDQGLIDKEDIRKAAVNLFTTRYLLGEFEDNEYDSINYEVVECSEHLAIARKAAEETIVLLKNDKNILPLDKAKISTVGVIGPNADSRKALMGNYHGTASRYTTVLEGIQDYVGDDVRVLYSLGSHLFLDKEEFLAKDDDRLAEAVIVAKHSDVVILCLGLDESLEGEEGDTGNSYASGDKKDLMLPPSQQRLLETVLNTGKPVIVCMMAGSSIDMSLAQEKADAILQCWYPGAQGGKTVADIIFGELSPSGKLPLTFYHNSDLDKMPAFDDYSMEGRTYRYFKGEPLYPFGFGLTYADVKINNAELQTDFAGLKADINAKLNGADPVATFETLSSVSTYIGVELSNTSAIDTDEVIQIYVKTDSRFETGNGKLAAYKRVHIRAGETARYEIDIPERAWTVVDENGNRIIDGSKAKVTVSLNGLNKCKANAGGAGFKELEI